MNKDKLNEMINDWEPIGCDVVRTIDTHEDTIERIVKYRTHIAGQELYSLYRYFTIGECVCNVQVSVDLDGVEADRVIQELAERV